MRFIFQSKLNTLLFKQDSIEFSLYCTVRWRDLTMAVRFRLPALVREALAEFASTFILLVSGLSDSGNKEI